MRNNISIYDNGMGADKQEYPYTMTYNAEEEKEIIISDLAAGVTISMGIGIFLEFVNRVIQTKPVDVTLQEVS